MKKNNIFLLFIILIMATASLIIAGCSGVIPGDISDGGYDQNNTELHHIKIFPDKLEMKVNQPQIFEVKAYNSDNKLISIDVSEIKWVVMYECSSCGIVWNLYPTKGSQKTTFTPKKTGKYTIHANYKDDWGKADKVKVEVIK